MNLAAHVALAFASGIIVETLYTLNVIFISERKGLVAGAIGVAWGAAFLAGVNESFKTPLAATAWCLGLGVGTVIGVRLKKNSA